MINIIRKFPEGFESPQNDNKALDAESVPKIDHAEFMEKFEEMMAFFEPQGLNYSVLKSTVDPLLKEIEPLNTEELKRRIMKSTRRGDAENAGWAAKPAYYIGLLYELGRRGELDKKI